MGKHFSKAKLCQMELTVVQWEETPWAERGSKPLPPNLTGPGDGRVEGIYPGASRAPPGTSRAASCPHVPRMLYSWMLKPWKTDCTTIPHALPPLTIEPLRDHYSLSTKWVQSKYLTDTKIGGLFWVLKEKLHYCPTTGKWHAQLILILRPTH